jgi:hypothetical protein
LPNANELLQSGSGILFLGGLSRDLAPTESNTMSFAFDKGFRIRAAIATMLLYAVCILAPSAACAFDMVAHCLAGPFGAAHVHQAGAKSAVHHNEGTSIHSGAGKLDPHSDANEKGRGGSCCGLFCVTAIAHEPGVAAPVPPAIGSTGPGIAYELTGRGPDRINRPPIA